MVFLPKITLRDKGHVTNLFFTEISLINSKKEFYMHLLLKLYIIMNEYKI